MKATVKTITPKEVNGSKFVLIQLEAQLSDSFGTISRNIWVTRQTVDAKLKAGQSVEIDESKLVSKTITAYGKQVQISVLQA